MACPFCNGSGIASKTGTHKNSIADMETAYKMRQNGSSLREIAGKLGKKYPQSVKHMIERYHNYLVDKANKK